MAERMNALRAQALEFWNKYTIKQKSIVISVAVGVLCAFLLLFLVLNRTQYKKLITCEDTKQSNEVVKLLDGAKIKYKLSGNSTVISVDKSKFDDAQLLLGSESIPTNDDMSLQELFKNSLSTTESERKLKSTIYWQDKLANTIKTFDGVKDAVVYITNSEKDDSILSEEVTQSASIVLTTKDDFKTSAANTIAQMVASAIDTTTDKVRVTSSSGTVLYDGTSDLYSSGDLGSVEEYKQKLVNTRSNDIRILLVKQGYDDAEVLPNFTFNMDKVEELYTEYTPAEGSDQGVYKSSYEYKSENANGTGGVPGTDSNTDNTTYQTTDTNSSTGTVEYSDIDYLPNVRVTNTIKEVGAIDAATSSISIVLTKYKVYSEDALKENGDLKKTTFEKYIADKGLEKVNTLTVDNALYQSVSSATGIATGNISITAYEQPIFKFSESTSRPISDYIMVVLLVLIIGMLVFVVIKGTVPFMSEELEPELSVEEMLATSMDAQALDDITYNEKSESRRMIENFVDDNPEAVAQLLRNWLNEDWG